MSLDASRLALDEQRLEFDRQRLAFEERRLVLDDRLSVIEVRRLEIEDRKVAVDEHRESRLSEFYDAKRKEALSRDAAEESEDAEPPKPKPPSKITDAQRTWSRCWFASGAEMLPNSQDPYIGRSALSEMLRSDGVSEPKIKAALDPSKPSLIGSLIGSELIRFSGHGWVALGYFADNLRKLK